MDTNEFLNGIIPGNYFITKSMELTKSQSSGTLWYTKKFIVLYYYIFLNNNITTLAVAAEIRNIFDEYINSLPEDLQDKAKGFFYASAEVADLRSDKFKLFGDFAGQKQFADDAERISYYESAKKYYFAFLMESGGQSGVKAYIKDSLYKDDFVYSDIDNIIRHYADNNGYNTTVYKTPDAYVSGIRNDYMAFVRNERQILFYYGFFHSKSSGSNDLEFSSLTPLGELALNSNYYELIALWEHQKVKMVSQPVNIEIRGLENSRIGNSDFFTVNINPYLTILRSLKSTSGFSKGLYQYIISRLPEYPDDGVIDTSDHFLKSIIAKVNGFNRKADVESEDFTKELLKYLLGIRSDLSVDNGANPLGLCKWSKDGVSVTDLNRLDRLIEIYSVLCDYKIKKYSDVIQNGAAELKRQYICKAAGAHYTLDPQIKIAWDMYNIHPDIFILLSVCVLLSEAKSGQSFASDSIDDFVKDIRELCPNILKKLGMYSKSALKRELKNILNAFTEKTFDAYLLNNSDNYSNSIASHLNVSLADLEKKIKEISGKAPEYVDGVRKRNMALIGLIKSYNLQKYSANGEVLKCECCGNPTFITYKKESYVEYHHMIPFSEYDGPDNNLNILALCPMCHRKFHFLSREDKQPLYAGISDNSYAKLSVENRLVRLYDEHQLKSYQLEFLLADKAIDEETYNRIIN